MPNYRCITKKIEMLFSQTPECIIVKKISNHGV
uniref:Uncharacterized protein n=1 Tax=viral metagenome TaxID=1070528 RepID=A0A6C0F6H5_9ZZZZ